MDAATPTEGRLSGLQPEHLAARLSRGARHCMSLHLDRGAFRWRGPVAQWLEPAAHNGLVGGSNPPGPTSFLNGLR
jgi:hypothetical protein